LSLLRRATAPVSVALLIIVAALTFASLQTSSVPSPPILDPNFELWVESSAGSHPLAWQFEHVEAADDSASLKQTQVGGMKATELAIFRGGETGWTYAYLSQVIDGARLTALFTQEIEVSVMREACICSSSALSAGTLFGVEVNDGTHILTYVFSEYHAETQVFLAHRIVSLQTPSSEWVQQRLDFAEQYDDAQWKTPDRVTLSIVFGVGLDATGWQRAYVHGFTVARSESYVNSMPIATNGGTQVFFCLLKKRSAIAEMSRTGVKI
jgi:hypothetical protein